ncbi:hypothetical protein [Streptomyces sp. B21-102]
MLAYARPGGTIVVYTLDRLGRNLHEFPTGAAAPEALSSQGHTGASSRGR